MDPNPPKGGRPWTKLCGEGRGRNQVPFHPLPCPVLLVPIVLSQRKQQGAGLDVPQLARVTLMCCASQGPGIRESGPGLPPYWTLLPLQGQRQMRGAPRQMGQMTFTEN